MTKTWIEIAERAKVLLRDPTTYGNRLKRRESVAEQLGVSRQTLRNYSAAYEYMQSATDPDIAALLRELPATAVETYARWAHGNEKEAFAHLRLHAGKVSVREVIAAEKGSRARAGTQREPTMIELAHRLQFQRRRWEARDEIWRVFRDLDLPSPDLDLLEWKAAERAYDRTMGIREVGYVSIPKLPINSHVAGQLQRYLHSRGGGDTAELVGVLPVGRRGVADLYRNEAKLYLARAIAAAQVFPLVIIILPDNEATEPFESQLPEMPYVSMGVKKQVPTAVTNESGAHTRSGSPLRVTTSGSAILVTSWEDFETRYLRPVRSPPTHITRV